ncbi:MAG: cytochrome C oxidase subunit IV family protein [Panacagrimonas sp.]
MSALTRDRVTWVWLLLMLITGGSYVLGTQSGASGYAATAAILVLSFFKVRLIVLHFMEVRDAPLGLRAACEIWIVVLLAALLWMYA